MQFDLCVGKIPWRRAWQLTLSVFLPGDSPRTEKPVGLWSIGSQRVRHGWSDLACTHVRLINGVVTVLGGRWRDSAIHVSLLPPNSPPIQAATWHWAELPVLDSSSLLDLHVKYSSVSMSIPNSLTISSPILPPGDHKVITEDWAEFPVLDSRSLLVIPLKYNSMSVSIPNSLCLSPSFFLYTLDLRTVLGSWQR